MLQLLKSRTVWFVIALAVLSILQGYVGLPPIGPIGPIGQMFVGIAIGVAVVLLHTIITKPIGEK